MPETSHPRADDQAEAFRLIVDYTHDWELWLGPQREIRYISPACERISGYAPETFLADPALLTAIVHPEDRATVAHHMEDEFQHPEPLALEFRIVTRTGEECWIHHTCRPVHGTDGHWLGRRASNRDVTERVRSEEAYRNLVLHARQGLLILQDERVVFANQAASAMTGYTPEELMHRQAKDMMHAVHAEDRPFVWSHFQERVAGTPLPHHYDFRFVRKDGGVRHWEIDSYLLDYHGRPAVHVALWDVTDQREAQAAKDRILGELRDSEARFRRRSAELESLHAISLQLNAQTNTTALLRQILDQAVALLDVEAGLFFLYDAERDLLIGEIATELLADYAGTHLARGQGLAWQVFESRRAQTVTNYDRWPQRVVLATPPPWLRNLMATPLIGKDGVLGVLNLGGARREFGDQDLWLAEMFAAQAAVALESARLLARVERHSRELMRVEKMAALGRMAAALAHEINNPLQAIQSHVDLVLDFPLPPEQQTEFLGVVRTEMTRLTEIVQRVLTFARPAPAPRRAVALDEMIRQTLALAGKQLQRSNIQVTTTLAPGLIVAVGPDQIVQVFLNLVINAIDAIGRNGTIAIDVAGAGSQAVITVANDGPPIAQSDLAHVFEPFFTTKSDGTGLGLAVSQKLIEQYDGRITVANQAGDCGVIFTVLLPLVQTESSAP